MDFMLWGFDTDKQLTSVIFLERIDVFDLVFYEGEQ